jgi:hypothetical protein
MWRLEQTQRLAREQLGLSEDQKEMMGFWKGD